MSIGITTQSSDHTTLTELISQADQALYQAKTQGRNRVVVAFPTAATSAPSADET